MYYSRGSIQESITWITKARNRGFIEKKQATDYIRELQTIRRMLNGYIRSLNKSR
jgi:four helix bundle protein